MVKKISVIIPIYNMGKYLEECLGSIVNQSIEGLEIIAVNDGSTDNSLDILKRYSQKYPNIIIHSQSNQGQASAKNYGILHATGKYIAIMDPDDYYPNNECLERLYNCAEENGAIICGGLLQEKSGDKIYLADPEVAEEYYHNQFVDIHEYNDMYRHQRYLYNREFLIDNNILFPLYRRYEDQPFTIKALCTAGVFYASDIPVYIKRVAHKTEKNSLRVCIDILCGIRDAARICKDNNLERIYERSLCKIVDAYQIPFYKYAYMGINEIDDVIQEINEIFIEWKGEPLPTLDKELVCRYREESLELYNSIKKILLSGKPVILYGAGQRADFFLQLFAEEKGSIIGMAVSDMRQDESFNGYRVSYVGQYATEELKTNAYILVTTLSIHWEEITKRLDEFEFKNVLTLDMNKLRLANSIINEV
uniref:glycosyltransferase n=1 Tax=Acetatifactor sp. TaxID=1872090 RepID=UPI0040560F66